MTTEHTPGPWELNWTIANGGQHPNFPTLHYVAIEAENADRPSLHICGYIPKADAYLLAAAPDLLAALKNLYALVNGECPGLLEGDHHNEMVSAAIAKAEGQS